MLSHGATARALSSVLAVVAAAAASADSGGVPAFTHGVASGDVTATSAILWTRIDRDTVTATRMLEQLGEMLRRVVRTGGPAVVPLSEEIEFVRLYLAIEEARFADRLRATLDVPEGVSLAHVPELILQPIVENAIRHGLSRRVGPTDLTVSARREGDTLVLSVTDEGGPASQSAAGKGEGVGLRNARERLATLYGYRGSLALAATPTGGTTAVIRLPYRESTVAE